MIEIAAYVFDQSKSTDATNAILETLFATFTSISRSPRIGTPRPHLGRGLRSDPSGSSYMVYYRIRRDYVEITRVLHQRRDLRKAFPKRMRP